MNDAAQVDIIIKASASGVTTGVAQAQKSLAGLGKGAGAASVSVQSAMDKMSAAARRAVAPIAAAAAAYLSYSSAMAAINRAGELDKLSASLDLSVEKLQELQYAAEQTGATADGMAQGLRQMGLFLDEVRGGGEEATKSLRALGLALDGPGGLAGMSADEQFKLIAEALAKIPDAQKRAALANDIFSRSSKDLAQTLTVGKAGLDALGKSAQETGLVVSKIDNSKLEELGDVIDTATRRMQAMVSKGLAGVAPALGGIIDAMTQLKVAGDGTADVAQLLSKWWVAAAAVAAKAWYGLQMILVGLGMAVNGLAELATKAVGMIWDGFSWLTGALRESWKTVAAAASWAWADVKKNAMEAFGAVAGAWSAMVSSVGTRVRELGLLMNEAYEGSGDALVNAGESAERFATKLKTDVSSSVAEAKKDMDDAAATMASTVTRIMSVKAGARPEWMQSLNTYFEDARAKGMALLADLGVKAVQTQDQLSATFDKIGADGAGGGDNGQAAADAQVQVKKAMYGELSDLEGAYFARSDAAMRQSVAARAAQELAAANLAISIHGKKFADLSAAAEQYNSDDFARRQARLEQEAADETAEYEKTKAALETKIAMKQAEHAALAALEAQHATNQANFKDGMAQMDVQRQQRVMGDVAGVLGQAAALMDKNNKSQFTAWKVFATGQATVNAMLGFTNILADKSLDTMMGGPWYRIGMASTVLGLGLAQAAKIASTPFGGKGGGGSASVSAPERGDSSNQGGPGGNTNVNVALYGSNFSQDSVRGLISAINDASSDNFQIKAS